VFSTWDVMMFWKVEAMGHGPYFFQTRGEALEVARELVKGSTTVMTKGKVKVSPCIEIQETGLFVSLVEVVTMNLQEDGFIQAKRLAWDVVVRWFENGTIGKA
jgi:hypothetical protein